MSENLIARLCAASGPDRELDVEIFIEVTPGVKDAGRIDRGENGVVGWWPQKGGYQSAREVPRYTDSLDAAKGLIPSAWQWDCGTCNEDDLPWACLTSTDTYVDYSADAWSPGIAICIAALRARES